MNASRTRLADAALHGPADGFSDEDFSPHLYDEAALLRIGSRGTIHSRTATSEPRGAWLEMFIDLDGGRWSPDPPEVEALVTAVLAAAAREYDEQRFARLLHGRAALHD